MSDLNPTTNPDVQEALSRRYGNETIILMVLKSNRIALFDRQFTLQAILEETPRVEDLKRLALECETSVKRQLKQAEANRFYGEPDDRQWIRDQKTQMQKTQAQRTKAFRTPIVEGLDL